MHKTYTQFGNTSLLLASGKWDVHQIYLKNIFNPATGGRIVTESRNLKNVITSKQNQGSHPISSVAKHRICSWLAQRGIAAAVLAGQEGGTLPQWAHNGQPLSRD